MDNNELLYSFLNNLEANKRYNKLDSNLLSDIFKYYLIGHGNNNLDKILNIISHIDGNKQTLLKKYTNNEQLESLVLLIKEKVSHFKSQTLLKEYLKRDVNNKEEMILKIFDNERKHCDTLLVDLIANNLVSKEFIVDNNFDTYDFKSYYLYIMKESFETNNEHEFELN